MSVELVEVSPQDGMTVHKEPSQNAKIYKPLPPRGGDSAFIRVFDLARKTKDPSEPLKGELRLVNLRECPKFAALSYVWGEASEEAKIICGDQYLPITRNCHDALRSLRALYGPITIWADAICINQEDKDEKAIQIPLMQEIYTWAHTVYAWLGEGSQQTTMAMECLKRASALRLAPGGVPWTDGGRVETLLRDRFHSVFALAFLFIQASIPYWQRFQAFRVTKSFDRHALDELLNHEWIRRAWKFQEIVLASNPIVVCGGKTITWSRLKRGLDYLNDPVKPFHISFMDLLLASFSYEGPKKTIPTRKSPRIHEVHSLTSFHIWRQIHQIWDTVYRESSWNHRKFRKLPLTDSGSPVPMYSVESYQDGLLNPRKTWYFSRLIVSAAYLSLPLITFGFSASLPIYQCYRSRCPDEFLYRDSNNFYSFYIVAIVFSSIWGALITVYVARTAPQADSGGEESTMPIIGLVQALRERRAKDPADKAFSLHAVLSRTEIPTSKKPDYTKSYGKVYHALFLDLLRHNTSLVNLLVDVGPRLPGVPSWVPDWSNLHERSWLDERHVHNHVNLYGASFPKPQMGIREDTLRMWSINKGSVAICSGAFQRTKGEQEVSSHPEGAAALDQAVKTFAEWVRAIGETASTQISHEQKDPRKDIYDVLMGRQSDTYDSKLEVFQRWLHIMQDQPANTSEHDSPRSSHDIFSGDSEALVFTINCCNQLAGKRVLFITQEGKLGTGPCSMAAGDRLQLLRRVAVPMVIRSVGEERNRFELVGPAFVRPFIDVDAFNRVSNGPDWEEVSLV